jgi:hypothetical protein
MAAAELLYAQLTQQLAARLRTFIFQKMAFCVRTALMRLLLTLLQPPSSTRKDTNMKNMYKMPSGSMMKDSDMSYGGESKKMEKMEHKMGGSGYSKKMASGGSVTPRGNGQARNKPCKIC